MYTSRIHCVVPGTGTPKDEDEVNTKKFVSVMGECVFVKL